MQVPSSLSPTSPFLVNFAGALWHVLNFVAAAAGIALLASLAVKLLWHRDLKSTAWLRLWTWSFVAAAAAAIGGLVFFGHDGKMATYAVMVVACALGLLGAGFGPGRR